MNALGPAWERISRKSAAEGIPVPLIGLASVRNMLVKDLFFPLYCNNIQGNFHNYLKKTFDMNSADLFSVRPYPYP